MLGSGAAKSKPLELKNKVWKGRNGTTKSGKDSQAFGNVNQSSLYAYGGEDILSIAAIANSLVDMGADNDTLTIRKFADGMSSLNGGDGNADRLILGYQQSAFTWTWNAETNSWLLMRPGTSNGLSSISNFENVQFADKTSAKLSAGSITVNGTKNKDSILIYSSGIEAIAVASGAGNDTISFSGVINENTPIVTIDGGSGTDIVRLAMGPEAYRFSQEDKNWKVISCDDLGLIQTWYNAFSFRNIETVLFGDGSTMKLNRAGIDFTAGSKAVTVTGTEGNDRLRGSAKDDTFIRDPFKSLGNDYFDLRDGGGDTVDFSTVFGYSPANVTIFGARADDKIEFGDLTPSGTTAYTKAGFLTGTLTVSYGLLGDLSVKFVAPS